VCGAAGLLMTSSSRCTSLRCVLAAAEAAGRRRHSYGVEMN